MARLRSNGALCLASALLALLVACVPSVAIEGAPCPCPSGYVCCPALLSCVAEGDASACPSSGPASSGSPCQRDSECEGGETCHAWTTRAGELAGPRACRRLCSGDAPCGQSERCQLVPHDGSALLEAELVRACVSPAPPAGHESCECTECDESTLGQTYCQGSLLMGCFLAFNEACGVACKQVTVQDCGGQACTTETGSAQCPFISSDEGEVCQRFRCDACDAASEPYTCQDNLVLGCSRAAHVAIGCEQICLPTTFACPAGSMCVEGEAERCGPSR